MDTSPTTPARTPLDQSRAHISTSAVRQMTSRVQNPPKALAAPSTTRATPTAPSRWTDRLERHRIAALAIALIGVAAAAAAVLALASRGPSEQTRIDLRVTRLLAGIPQHGRTLGYPSAPVTLEVFADLKDPDSRTWWNDNLPAIIQQDVRTGRLQLQFHSFKTNTNRPNEFVREQTAALAAGAQNKLWNYADIFYHQQRNRQERSEFDPYATNSFLQTIAHQTTGLNLARWQTDQYTEHREEQPSEESHTAHEDGLHVTPSFRIGHTGGPLTNYSGAQLLKYKRQNPIALIQAQDINKTLKELAPAARRKHHFRPGRAYDRTGTHR